LQFPDAPRHLLKLGAILRQPDIGLGTGTCRNLRFEQVEAFQYLVRAQSGKGQERSLIGMERASAKARSSALRSTPGAALASAASTSSVSPATGSSASMALTGPIAAGDIEMARKPSPINAMAETGRPASSPQSVSGVPVLSAALTIRRSVRMKGTLSGSKRSEISEFPRSTAMTNWNRSLDPTDTKSTASINSSSWKRSDGTSSIAPSFKEVGS